MNYGALLGGLRSRSLPSRVPLSWSYWEHVRLPAGGAYIEVAAPGPLLSMLKGVQADEPQFLTCAGLMQSLQPNASPWFPWRNRSFTHFHSTKNPFIHLAHQPSFIQQTGDIPVLRELKNTCVQGLFSIYCLPISGSWRYRGEKDSLCLPGTRESQGRHTHRLSQFWG